MKNIIKKISEFYSDLAAQVKKHDMAFKLILAFFLFLTVFYLSTNRFRKEQFDLKVGDIAPYDIKIKRNIEYVDYIKTEEKRKDLISKISPVFSFDLGILEEEKKKVDAFFDKVLEIDNEFDPFERKIEQAKSIKLMKDANLLKILFLNFKENNFRNKAKEVLTKIYNAGVTDLDPESITSLGQTGNIIKIYNNEQGEEISIRARLDDLYYLKTINYFEVVKSIYSSLRWDKVQFLNVYVKRHVRPNLLYDKKLTDEKIVNAIGLVKPVGMKLKKGQVIVRYGEEISESDFKILKEVVKYSSETSVIRGYFVVLLALFILSLLIFKIYSPAIFNNLKTFLFLLSFIFIAVLLTYLFPNFNSFLKVKILSSFYIPIGGFAILIHQLTNYATSFWVLLFISILSMFLVGFNFVDFIIILLIGFSAVILSGKLKKRIYMWYLGLLIGLFYSVLNLGMTGIMNFSEEQFLNSLLMGFVNGIISIIISMGLYPLFEYFFNMLTEYKLMELSDLNLPIMKRLLIEGPGTYNHSILVANMAETATLAIGANSLLARVGGYYHDIGKLENPEYFIENQFGDDNKHQKIKPSISSSIVKSHVKYGEELAGKLKVPIEIINIIKEHHGTTMISFFYRKALEDVKSGKSEKQDMHTYKYEGPMPTSKEAAIIMLADSVEAASRALKNPSYTRLQNMVRELINERFLDGQLDDCSLTLMDLKKIEESFSHVLSAMFHTRIEYPDQNQIKKLENEN
ncbi:MAG: HDIG domain-containing protein [Spirochaetes bacterium]|nr:HDIG domain-containing protein [Spirochaetota bacterium]